MSFLIYKITSPIGKTYIGQTGQAFEVRMSGHKSAAADLEKTDGCRHLNSAIRLYGWDNMIKEIIETNIPEESIDERECYFIALYKAMTPEGYNLTTGGSKNKHLSEETKSLQREAALKRDVSIYRKKEITKNWPKYLGIFDGYPRITKHPNCSCKRFADTTKTFEQNLEEAKTFLDKLNSGEVRVKIPERELPEGLQKMGDGYRVYVKNVHSVRIIKNFANKKIPIEVRLQQAKDFLASIEK